MCTAPNNRFLVSQKIFPTSKKGVPHLTRFWNTAKTPQRRSATSKTRRIDRWRDTVKVLHTLAESSSLLVMLRLCHRKFGWTYRSSIFFQVVVQHDIIGIDPHNSTEIGDIHREHARCNINRSAKKRPCAFSLSYFPHVKKKESENRKKKIVENGQYFWYTSRDAFQRFQP